MDKLLRCPELCRREKGIICEQCWIVKRKNQDAADKSPTITAPHIMHNIANTPRPDKAEVITARQTSSFPPS